MVSGVGGRESGGNSWCLHQAISITLLLRVFGIGEGWRIGGIGCMLAEPQQLPCSGIGFSGTLNTMWDAD